MAKEFKSRLGKAYYVKPRKTKKGNTTYFLTTKVDEMCLDVVPEGYEVYENFSAQMLYIRKKKASLFSLIEQAIIRKELNKNKSIDGFELDIYGAEIRVYQLEDRANAEPSLFQFIPKDRLAIAKAYLMQYTENMRIKKVVKKDFQEFIVMRYCYRGAIDDWIVVDAGNDLKELVENNLVHLGKESFYDLFPII